MNSLPRSQSTDVRSWRPLSSTHETSAQTCQLDNGLTLIHQQIPASPAAVVDVWIKAGTAAEPQDWGGVAHFLEHMVFKGTANLSPGQFDWAVECQGGVSNAATSHDYTHYFITGAAAHLPRMLPCLAELLLHAAIPETEFWQEQAVVLAEIRQAQDNPDWLSYQQLTAALYDTHPYGRSVLGQPESLQALTPETTRQFHQSTYQPDNMTVVIVGGIDQAMALDLVAQCFTDFPHPRHQLDGGWEYHPCPNSLVITQRQHLYLPQLEQARLMLAWPGPGAQHLDATYGMDLLSLLLAEVRTSRLVQELRQQRGWVHGISSQYMLQQRAGKLLISVWLDPCYLADVENLICDRLQDLADQPITSAELERAKRILCNDYVFGMESPQQLAGLYGYFQTIHQASSATVYPERIQQLQPADLQSLASQYLAGRPYAVTTVEPA